MTGPEADTAAPVVTEAPPAAPVAPEAAPPVEAAPPAPAVAEEPVVETPQSRRDVRRGLTKDLTAPPAPASEAAAPAAEPPSAPAAPAPPAPAAPAAPALIRIAIPEGHPMREMMPPGAEYIEVANAQQERAVRASLNSYIRRQERDSAVAEAARLRREQIAREARDSALAKWQGRPEYAAAMARAQEIRESFGNEEADNYLAGKNREFETLARQELDERLEEQEANEKYQAAESWKADAWNHVQQLPALVRQMPGFSTWFEEACRSFDAELGLGHFPNLRPADPATGRTSEQAREDMHRAFMQFFDGQLKAKPEVDGLIRSINANTAERQRQTAAREAAAQAERERIQREAVEQYKRDQMARRGQIPPHPLGSLAAGRDRPAPLAPEAAEPAAPASSHALRKSLRQGVKEDVARRLGT